MSLLLLFDIDGTLLHRAADDHSAAIHAALREVYGVEPVGVELDPAGRTDPEIGRLILLARGVDGKRIDDGLHDFHIAACRSYAERSGDLAATVAPGAPELLGELARSGRHIVALLTGNFEPIARLKLRRARIGQLFAPGQGAFGSDSEDRSHLPGLARRRAGATGRPWPRERTVVIGDTPLDIACARAEQVRCVAVATGRWSPAELAHADAVVARFSELGEVLEDWDY
jgi:phosphoglycolate phosphatase